MLFIKKSHLKDNFSAEMVNSVRVNTHAGELYL